MRQLEGLGLVVFVVVQSICPIDPQGFDVKSANRDIRRWLLKAEKWPEAHLIDS